MIGTTWEKLIRFSRETRAAFALSPRSDKVVAILAGCFSLLCFACVYPLAHHALQLQDPGVNMTAKIFGVTLRACFLCGFGVALAALGVLLVRNRRG